MSRHWAVHFRDEIAKFSSLFPATKYQGRYTGTLHNQPQVILKDVVHRSIPHQPKLYRLEPTHFQPVSACEMEIKNSWKTTAGESRYLKKHMGLI